MPDPTSRIRFSSVFSKKAWLILCRTSPDPIWMAWSGFGQRRLVWKQAGVQESYGPVSGRMHPARCQCPTFRLDSILPQTDNIVQNQPGSGQVLAKWIRSGFGQVDPVRFWPSGSGQEACRFKNHPARFWPMLPP